MPDSGNHTDELCPYCGDYLDFCGHDLTNVKPNGAPVRVPNEWNAELIKQDKARGE